MPLPSRKVKIDSVVPNTVESVREPSEPAMFRGLSWVIGNCSLLCVVSCTSPAGSPAPDLAVAVGALKVCPSGGTVPGVDVSDWQGDIDWDAVAASGITFAIARVAHGTALDGGSRDGSGRLR
jgi:hypothetical protein